MVSLNRIPSSARLQMTIISPFASGEFNPTSKNGV